MEEKGTDPAEWPRGRDPPSTERTASGRTTASKCSCAFRRPTSSSASAKLLRLPRFDGSRHSRSQKMTKTNAERGSLNRERSEPPPAPLETFPVHTNATKAETKREPQLKTTPHVYAFFRSLQWSAEWITRGVSNERSPARRFFAEGGAGRTTGGWGRRTTGTIGSAADLAKIL